jgi:hypothetical protein
VFVCPPPPSPAWQVEARLRQLEGRVLASEGAKPKAGREQPAKYEPASKANGKAYNADADVAPAAAAAEDKKAKKVRGGCESLLWQVLGYGLLGLVGVATALAVGGAGVPMMPQRQN